MSDPPRLPPDRGRETLLEVRRTGQSGRTTLARLESWDGSLVLTPARGGEQPLEALGVLEAVAKQDALRTVRPGQVTEVRTWPHAGCTDWEVAARLRFERPHELSDDLDDWELPEEVARLLGYSGAGSPCEAIGNRAVYINGARWVPTLAAGRARPVLVPARADWDERGVLLPALSETWGSFKYTERESRAGGVNEHTLGRVGDAVVCEIDDLDVDLPEVRLRWTPEPSRLQEIARWLVDLEDFVFGPLDVRMLAVELLAGELTSPALASDFDDEGSDTTECHLSIAVEAGEVAAFLWTLAKAGGREAVDAVELRNSGAGRRRAARLRARE